MCEERHWWVLTDAIILDSCLDTVLQETWPWSSWILSRGGQYLTTQQEYVFLDGSNSPKTRLHILTPRRIGRYIDQVYWCIRSRHRCLDDPDSTRSGTSPRRTGRACLVEFGQNEYDILYVWLSLPLLSGQLRIFWPKRGVALTASAVVRRDRAFRDILVNECGRVAKECIE